ncbi:hypothetical protein [Eikenella sp. Marseille-P7795]|uniref:hypothetical protein n=1 Tax=Eikenella sp. Marseille-P7795 TaxID=2866577 RepID=UPI001CE3EFFE|nr:hypothetical protein [Eikenella sp. Marseille-P7795]
MLVAAGVGMGALVSAAENHKRWQHLRTPVSYVRYGSGELTRRQWYDDDDNPHIAGTIRTAETARSSIWIAATRPTRSANTMKSCGSGKSACRCSAWCGPGLSYRVITELDYTKDGIVRQYRAEFSPQQEAEQWWCYARGWTRAALVAWGLWLWLSIAWYRRARRQRLRRKKQQKAT